MNKKIDAYTSPDNYTLFKITECDENGDLWAYPQKGEYKKQKFPVKKNKIIPALTVGDEFLGKFKKNSSGCFAKPVSRISDIKETSENENIFGVAERQNHTCTVTPIERSLKPYVLEDVKNIKTGDMVELEVNGQGRFQEIKIVKNYGPFSMSLLNEILITQKYKLPHTFDRNILEECQHFESFEDKDRLNLTHLPFVTIDGDDSRDFDDAVYASRLEDGFELIVAIADVSFYVKPQSFLDREACLRGNSVYLPQTVIPMLPEILSNDLCSLNPNVRRPVIACLMKIDRDGNLLNWDFKRAVIKSAARLTYKEVEAAINGKFNDLTKKMFTKAVQPLYEAYFALDKARRKRGTLELETTEIKIRFAKDGAILGIEKQEQLTSQKIIEEFMIAANVAAAYQLRKSKLPIMYRTHDRPTEEKLKDIKPVLESLKLKLPEYHAIKPQHFNKIIETCKKKGNASGISDLILRLQCQARYTSENIGHFGLGLKEYVHFTSPIRRYADLMIHRALCQMASKQELLPSQKAFDEIADHICSTERNAAAAERDMTARYLSLYLKPLIGTEFEVKISGLSNAGIFVRIEDLGAEGLVPMRSLPKDYYQLLDANSCLRGTSTKLKFKMGQIISVVLTEAAPITGGLIFNYLGTEEKPDTRRHKKKDFKKKSKAEPKKVIKEEQSLLSAKVKKNDSDFALEKRKKSKKAKKLSLKKALKKATKRKSKK